MQQTAKQTKYPEVVGRFHGRATLESLNQMLGALLEMRDQGADVEGDIAAVERTLVLLDQMAHQHYAS